MQVLLDLELYRILKNDAVSGLPSVKFGRSTTEVEDTPRSQYIKLASGELSPYADKTEIAGNCCIVAIIMTDGDGSFLTALVFRVSNFLRHH